MPASRWISGRITLPRILGATSASSSAHIRPISPPSSAAPAVASSDAAIIGAMPYSSAEGCQVMPVTNFHTPISLKAGMPWISRKITITESASTAAAAQRKKPLSTTHSIAFLIFFIRFRLPFFVERCSPQGRPKGAG